jgi:hypothetical protein
MIRRLVILVSGILLIACSQQEKSTLTLKGNAIYYWKVAFALDSTERAFLKAHDISRMYCRYFDVVMRPAAETGRHEPMPNATIIFNEPIPDSIEVVPTVFIMNDCMQHHPDSLAQRIVRRITQMNETNDIKGVREIQIDCDYTMRNRDIYYRFLQEVRASARQQGLALSVTIRLHQLPMPAPPADYGVLMLYNTGAPERFADRNPILDMRDVQPYLKHLHDYPLPLAAAYPVFLWQRTIHGVHIDHAADFDEIMLTKQAAEKEREDLRLLILTYHLDTDNIERYTSEQYEKIYHH